LAINNIFINIITDFLLKKKGKEIEIAKEVFWKQARAKEKLFYIRDQKNTILKNNK
jgi:hypothetical protein